MSWRHCLALILGTALLVCTPAVAQITFPDAPPTAAAPVASPAAALPIAAVQVEPFSTIQVCAPINVLVVPSNSSNNYTVTAEADTAVLQSLVAVVQNGTLQLQSSGNFNTSNIISLQVALPPTNLTGLVLSSPSSTVTITHGFSAPNFTVSSPFSSGAIFGLGLNVGSLSIVNSGTGSVLVNGSIGTATISSSGTGNVYLLGTNTSVGVDLAGTSSVYLRNANSNVQITGSSTGVNSVYYRDGICTIPSPFGFGGPCSQQTVVAIPTIDPQWTCGLLVHGNFTCAQAATAAGVAVSPEAAAATAPSLAASSGNPSAATATGSQTATAVGSPGQAATASAINNGTGVPPGSPVTSNANAVSTNAPATANAASVGRKLKQFPSDFFDNFNAAFNNLSGGSGTTVVSNGPGTQVSQTSGTGNQNAFASGNNAFASAVSGSGVSPSTFTSGGGSNTASSGISSSQFGGNVQSQICTADPSLLNILNTA